jgi:hypothetical protein
MILFQIGHVWRTLPVPKYNVHSVDARHFPNEGHYLFQATMEMAPKVLVTLRVNEEKGKKVMSELIAKGGPVEVELDYTDVVEAHLLP